MESAKYFILVGILLFMMAITPGLLKKLPITPSVIYLVFGMSLGSHGINILPINASDHTKIIEVLSELTVIISLFTVGLKLRLKLSDRLWSLPIKLASISMLLTISLIAIIGHYLLDLSLGLSILLGAIIAPTDPVLASDVQLSDPNDRDRKRFIITSEGGMNDGTAFPFVMLGLGLIGFDGKTWSGTQWFFEDLLWAIIGGLLIGALTGYLVSKITNYVKFKKKSFYLEDFLAISSIAFSYGMALQFHTYGFLAVFANALTIRQLELLDSDKILRPSHQNLPDDVLSFNEQLERIFEVVSVGLVGLLIDFKTFSWSSLLLAMTIIMIIRPVSIFSATIGSRLKLKEKIFLSWFGVRGIGSVYYLYFAINHAAPSLNKSPLIQYTLWTIFFSIFIHGISVKLIHTSYDYK